MKILPLNIIKNTLGAITVAGTMVAAPIAVAQQSKTSQISEKTEQCDTFEKAVNIPPEGTTSKDALKYAPSPAIKIQGKVKLATIVVDLNKNVLYHYDKNGVADIAYSVASGHKNTPTHTGVRRVFCTETYPYRWAPQKSKRRRNPKAYGPKIIILETLNPKTGETGATGEFIHGNNNPSSIGKYASHGCIRMDNEVIKKLSEQVKRDDIVIIQRDGKY